MRTPLLIAISGIAFLTVAGIANAITTIPGHGDFADDDGTELWIPDAQVLSFKSFENPAVTGLASFGFYFSSDPDTLITIFGTEDQDLTSQARIDFNAGEVFDIDDDVTQSSFTDLGTSIGFWFALDELGLFTIFTQSSLTTGGFDYAYSWPSLSDPAKYALVFFVPEGGDTPIAIDVIAGITPIPEPATALLVACGLVGLGLKRRPAAWRDS